MASLYDAIMELIEQAQRRGASGGAAGSGANLYQRGTVVAVKSDGTYDVSVNGATMNANPETDLPLTPGQPVWVSPVRNGKPLVHGPR